MDAGPHSDDPGATVDEITMGSSAVTAVMLAHQGGWDEFLMVAAPIVVFALLLRAANRRVSNLEEGDRSLFEAEDDSQSRNPKGLV